MIYIIFGASGSGKTTLLLAIREHLGNQAINIKATTREMRSYDDFEVVSFPDGIPKDQYEYFYTSYGHEYAIDKDQLDDAVKNGYHHFVICNDIPTIEKIKADFRFNVKVIYLDFDAPEETIREIQKRRGITDDEIELRISKIKYLKDIFLDNSTRGLFDDVILNNFSENPEVALWPKIQNIIGEQQPISNFDVLKQLVDYLLECKDKMDHAQVEIADPKLIVKDFLFVIMAMQNKEDKDADTAKYNHELFAIESSIIAAASHCNMRAELANNNHGGDMIMSKIVENIKKAEIIVADLTYERQNCYFELGYAMALRKKIIITAKEGTKIHFDVRGYEILTYDSPRDLNDQLKQALLNMRS